MFILGPGAGVLVGLLGVAALELVRKKLGVRRDYESLYSLGLGFTAFAAAEMVHGSGFLAAFAAGMTIAALDVELCDCFVEYGEATAEMLLLFTFVLLGTSLIWSGLTGITGATLLFTALAVLVRTPVYLALAVGFGRGRAQPPLDRVVRAAGLEFVAAGPAPGLCRAAGQRAGCS